MKKNKREPITANDLTLQAINESLPPESNDDLEMDLEMNEEDARASGYTDSDGHAVSMAKKDVAGKPTGALTDVGAGRSSVVRSKKGQKTIEDAPGLGDEQAP